jgi:hypothetical protein
VFATDDTQARVLDSPSSIPTGIEVVRARLPRLVNTGPEKRTSRMKTTSLGGLEVSRIGLGARSRV